MLHRSRETSILMLALALAILVALSFSPLSLNSNALRGLDGAAGGLAWAIIAVSIAWLVSGDWMNHGKREPLSS